MDRSTSLFSAACRRWQTATSPGGQNWICCTAFFSSRIATFEYLSATFCRLLNTGFSMIVLRRLLSFLAGAKFYHFETPCHVCLPNRHVFSNVYDWSNERNSRYELKRKNVCFNTSLFELRSFLDIKKISESVFDLLFMWKRFKQLPTSQNSRREYTILTHSSTSSVPVLSEQKGQFWAFFRYQGRCK